MLCRASQAIASEIMCLKVQAVETENLWDPIRRFLVKLAEFRSKKYKANYICGAQTARVSLDLTTSVPSKSKASYRTRL